MLEPAYSVQICTDQPTEERLDPIQLKNFLRDSSPEHHVFIAELYYTNNNITKITAKTRLFNKFNWLVYRYYLSCWRDGEYYDQNFSYVYLYRQAKRQVLQPATIATMTNTTKPTHPNTLSPPDPSSTTAPTLIPPITPCLNPSSPPTHAPPTPAPPAPAPRAPHPPRPPQPPLPQPSTIINPKDMVTFVNVNENSIDDHIVSLLSLGPGYALSLRLDEKGRERLLTTVQENIDAMATNLRWKELLAHTCTAKTLKQHVKTEEYSTI